MRIANPRAESVINEIASGVVADKIFGSWMLSDPEQINLVFAPLNWLSDEDKQVIKDSGVCAYYAFKEEAVEVIDGTLPCFAEVHFLVEEELPVLDRLIKRQLAKQGKHLQLITENTQP